MYKTNLPKLHGLINAVNGKRPDQSIEVAEQGGVWMQHTITRYDNPMPNQANSIATHASIGFIKLRWGRVSRFSFTIMLDDSWEFGGDKTNIHDFHGVHDATMDDLSVPGPVNLILEGDKFIGRVRHTKEAVVTEVPPVVYQHEFQAYKGVPMRIEYEYAPICFENQGDPVYRVRVNGELVAEYDGMNAYNDAKAPYPKTGLYQWAWNGPQYERKAFFTEYVYCRP